MMRTGAPVKRRNPLEANLAPRKDKTKTWVKATGEEERMDSRWSKGREQGGGDSTERERCKRRWSERGAQKESKKKKGDVTGEQRAFSFFPILVLFPNLLSSPLFPFAFPFFILALRNSIPNFAAGFSFSLFIWHSDVFRTVDAAGKCALSLFPSLGMGEHEYFSVYLAVSKATVEGHEPEVCV